VLSCRLTGRCRSGTGPSRTGHTHPMKIRLAVCLIAVLAVTACGGQTKPAAATSSSSATSTASVSAAAPSEVATTSPAAPAKGDKPTREFLIGKWGTDGDCALAIDLRPDGTSDGPFGNWTYTDGVIGFVDEPDFKVSVTVIDAQTMESTNDTGKTTKMTRCP
jgi:ABC-type Fe3+-hydroxamate transport system substrate-binding protein